MRIDLRRKPALMATVFALLLWLVAFACYRAQGVATGQATPRETLYLVATAAIGFSFSVAFGVAVLRMRLRPKARIAWGAALLVGLVVAHAWLDVAMIESYLRAKVVLTPQARVTGRGLLLLNNLVSLSPVYLTYAIGLGSGLLLRAVNEREQRLAAALAAQQAAQLAALRFQVNPHFLFNSLNAVLALAAAGRNRDIELVVTRLAEFFRATLAREPDATVSLEEEFDILGAYLDIESARFGPRLRVRMDLPEALGRAAIPHFLLQPLAENAIKHGVAPSLRPVTLAVAAREAGGVLCVSVEDDGAGGASPGSGTGVGLRNVEARLRAHYGDAASIAVARPAQGFRAVIQLPLSLVAADA